MFARLDFFYSSIHTCQKCFFQCCIPHHIVSVFFIWFFGDQERNTCTVICSIDNSPKHYATHRKTKFVIRNMDIYESMMFESHHLHKVHQKSLMSENREKFFRKWWSNENLHILGTRSKESFELRFRCTQSWPSLENHFVFLWGRHLKVKRHRICMDDICEKIFHILKLCLLEFCILESDSSHRDKYIFFYKKSTIQRLSYRGKVYAALPLSDNRWNLLEYLHEREFSWFIQK